jgi:hypothetical protein
MAANVVTALIWVVLVAGCSGRVVPAAGSRVAEGAEERQRERQY